MIIIILFVNSGLLKISINIMLQNNSACDLLPWQSEDQEETKVHLHHLCMPPHPSVSSHTQKQTSLSSHLALLI